jgi:hypothetical protein
MMKKEPRRRLLWFAALWLLGIAAVGLLALFTRMLLHAL